MLPGAHGIISRLEECFGARRPIGEIRKLATERDINNLGFNAAKRPQKLQGIRYYMAIDAIKPVTRLVKPTLFSQ